MAYVKPFKGLRYSARFGCDISGLICPPYDVIDAAMQEQLLSRHPCNMVRLELPPGLSPHSYETARILLGEWQRKGILKADEKECFYVSETIFSPPPGAIIAKKTRTLTPGHSAYVRRGMFCALRVEPKSKKVILPHEKTLPKPKSERLKLMETMRVSTSSIFGVFKDAGYRWIRELSPVFAQEPDITAKEDNGVAHKIWIISDKNKVARIKRIMTDKQILIADGHHRYEVARKFATLHKGHDFVFAYLSPAEGQGLLILPTHRIVKNAPAGKFQEELRSLFYTETCRNISDLVLELSQGYSNFPFLGVHSMFLGVVLARLKTDSATQNKLQKCLKNIHSVLRRLDVSVLHSTLLKDIDAADLAYTQDVNQVAQAVKGDNHSIGIILRPITIENIMAVAKNGEVMPPKSSYFYPKVPAGLTLMAV